MATSGELIKNFQSGYPVGGYYAIFAMRARWKLNSQSISNNTSSITVYLDMRARDGHSAVHGQSEWSVLADTWTNRSGSTSISGTGWRNYITVTKTIKHNADGTGNFSLEGWFKTGLLGIGTVSTGRKTQYLPTIPRKSTFNSVGRLNYADGYVSYNIKSASSSFTHRLEFIYKGSVLQTFDIGRTTNSRIGLSWGNLEKIAAEYYKNSTDARRFWLRLRTYSGGKQIGSTDGWWVGIDQPALGQVDSHANMYTNGSQWVSLRNRHSQFTYKVKLLYNAANGTKPNTNFKTFDVGSGTGATISFSSTEQNTLLQNMTNRTGTDFNLRTDNYFRGVYVGHTNSRSGNRRLNVPANIVPSFGIEWARSIDSKSEELLGGIHEYIYNISELRFRTSALTPGKYASVVNVTAKIGNTVRTWGASSGVVFDFGKVPIRKNGVLSVTLTDSRGRTATQNVSLTVYNYDSPSFLSYSAERVNGFEDETYISYKGRVSKIKGNVNNTPMVRTRVKPSNGSWGAWRVLAPKQSSSGDNWQLEDSNFYYGLLNNSKSHTIELLINDHISQSLVTIIVNKGQAIEVYSENNGYGGHKEYQEVVVGKSSIDGRSYPVMVTSDENFHEDTRDANNSPDWYITKYPRREVKEFKRAATLGITGSVGGYVALTTIVPWTDDSGGSVKQVALDDNGNKFIRSGFKKTGWRSWRRELNDALVADYVISSGSNSNGYWEKWKNGKLVCQHTITVRASAASKTWDTLTYKEASPRDWTYPQPFIDNKIIFTGTTQAYYGIVEPNAVGFDKAIGVTIYRPKGAAWPSADSNVTIQAVGRWK